MIVLRFFFKTLTRYKPTQSHVDSLTLGGAVNEKNPCSEQTQSLTGSKITGNLGKSAKIYKECQNYFNKYTVTEQNGVSLEN